MLGPQKNTAGKKINTSSLENQHTHKTAFQTLKCQKFGRKLKPDPWAPAKNAELDVIIIQHQHLSYDILEHSCPASSPLPRFDFLDFFELFESSLKASSKMSPSQPIVAMNSNSETIRNISIHVAMINYDIFIYFNIRAGSSYYLRGFAAWPAPHI